MKILHVIDQISQRTGGGASRVAYELACAQAQLGHAVTIYTTDYRADGQVAPDSVKLRKFRTWCNLFGSLRVSPGLLTAGYDYDIMHLHNYRTIVNLFAAQRHDRFVIQAHGSCLPISGLTKPLHKLIWNKLLLNKARYCIADAPPEIKQYVSEGGKATNIAHIPVGIKMAEYKKLPQRRTKGYKTVLYLGRFEKNKGADLLIRAFNLIKDKKTHLLLAGVDYGFELYLRKEVERLKLGDRVEWLGAIYGQEKTQAYVDADVFVMPSRYEMWGLVFMEALACGTPVVMTDKCNASRYLPQECGVSTSLNVKDMAIAIQKVLNKDMAGHLREYRRAWVTKYDWNNIAKKTIELYESVLR